MVAALRAKQSKAKAARSGKHRASEVRRCGYGGVGGDWSGVVECAVDSNKEGGEQEVGQVLLSCRCCLGYGGCLVGSTTRSELRV
jgi:hypothetical protein